MQLTSIQDSNFEKFGKLLPHHEIQKSESGVVKSQGRFRASIQLTEEKFILNMASASLNAKENPCLPIEMCAVSSKGVRYRFHIANHFGAVVCHFQEMNVRPLKKQVLQIPSFCATSKRSATS